jgi:glycosyltransferase involved in cell wall biosynthesis
MPGFPIDGVLAPGVSDHWLESPYHVRPVARILVFVGRLEANKGIAELLAIFKSLASAAPGLQLRVLGDGPLRQHFQDEIVRAGLADRVMFLGAAPAEQVRRELRNADVFVFPSRYESFGIAVLEAQAVGVPVVCSDIPALREAAGPAGLLLPIGDTDRWAEVIGSLIRDRPRREHMSRAGREWARGFTWRQVAQDLERYLRLGVSRCL